LDLQDGRVELTRNISGNQFVRASGFQVAQLSINHFSSVTTIAR
jgi:hypothetical protein